jgi:hypothetical protein
MQLVEGKPPETQYATRPGARAKRREVALGRLGFEPGRIRAWLSLRPSQGQLVNASLLLVWCAVAFALSRCRPRPVLPGVSPSPSAALGVLRPKPSWHKAWTSTCFFFSFFFGTARVAGRKKPNR